MLNRNFKLSNMVWPYKIWIIDNFLENKKELMNIKSTEEFKELTK